MIDITRLNELHAATTQGEWSRCNASDGKCPCGLVWSVDRDMVLATVARGDDDGPTIPDEQKFANGDFIAAAHNAWPAVVARLALLEEFARRVRASIHLSQTEYGDGREAERDIDWLDAETTKAGE